MKQVSTIIFAGLVILILSSEADCQQRRSTTNIKALGAASDRTAFGSNGEWRPRFSQIDSRLQSAAQPESANSWTFQEPTLNPSLNYPSNGALVGDYYPELSQQSVVEPSSQQAAAFQNSGDLSHSSQALGAAGPWQRSGYTPFVSGNIFGIGQGDYCDEWANHCPCLELTNSRSNCGCTNPYRTKNEPCRDGYRVNRTDCQGCSRSARRSTISEYFHPETNRR